MFLCFYFIGFIVYVNLIEFFRSFFLVEKVVLKLSFFFLDRVRRLRRSVNFEKGNVFEIVYFFFD